MDESPPQIEFIDDNKQSSMREIKTIIYPFPVEYKAATCRNSLLSLCGLVCETKTHVPIKISPHKVVVVWLKQHVYCIFVYIYINLHILYLMSYCAPYIFVGGGFGCPRCCVLLFNVSIVQYLFHYGNALWRAGGLFGCLTVVGHVLMRSTAMSIM